VEAETSKLLSMIIKKKSPLLARKKHQKGKEDKHMKSMETQASQTFQQNLLSLYRGYSVGRRSDQERYEV